MNTNKSKVSNVKNEPKKIMVPKTQNKNNVAPKVEYKKINTPKFQVKPVAKPKVEQKKVNAPKIQAKIPERKENNKIVQKKPVQKGKAQSRIVKQKV